MSSIFLSGPSITLLQEEQQIYILYINNSLFQSVFNVQHIASFVQHERMYFPIKRNICDVFAVFMEQELYSSSNLEQMFVLSFVKYCCAWKMIHMRCNFEENLYFLYENISVIIKHCAISIT
ncbi:LOW QUALITY PROTEIN: hypothetical protein V1477_010345 [Vespula maculifrons]|uniref:Uncharacterized protein n=1 Tax=Vespula maculifrons TaxID=7453 RepID=A0ABD2C948_VESMC